MTDRARLPKPHKPPRSGVLGLVTQPVFILWVLLIVMFLAIWQVLQPAGPRPDESMVDTSSDFWTQHLPTLLPLGFMTVMFVGLVWATQGFQRSLAEGTRLLAEGEYAKAEDVFAQTARRTRWLSGLSRVADHNRAVARLQRGDLAGAADLFARCAGRAGLVPSPLAPAASCHLALTYALRGDLAAAGSWRAEGARLAPKSNVAPGVALLLPLAEAIVDLREGRYEQGIGRLDENAKAMEGAFIVRWSRIVYAVRAFGIDRTVSTREAGAVDALVNRLRPATPGEFALITAEWPEMRTFLETRNLV